MPSRTFLDPDGQAWEAWDVFPGLHSDEAHEASRHLPDGLADGWLCFQREGQKRRLAPVPDAWDQRSDQDLWLYCQMARPVGGRKHQRG